MMICFSYWSEKKFGPSYWTFSLTVIIINVRSSLLIYISIGRFTLILLSMIYDSLSYILLLSVCFTLFHTAADQARGHYGPLFVQVHNGGNVHGDYPESQSSETFSWKLSTRVRIRANYEQRWMDVWEWTWNKIGASRVLSLWNLTFRERVSTMILVIIIFSMTISMGEMKIKC